MAEHDARGSTPSRVGVIKHIVHFEADGLSIPLGIRL